MLPDPNSPQLGTCYYPEHWPRAVWPEDARRMAALGLSYVRIGEFAWSRMEPRPGDYDWAWLEEALETLGGQGLSVVLCTPTPTPPKWLTDAHPEVLRVDEQGQRRRHGSRRHISLASATYRRFSRQITQALVDRFGQHRVVAGWQTDNEYGCHDSTLSYGFEDQQAFTAWLRAKYQDIRALNAAWGTAFWSQTYDDFSAVEVPNQLTAAANPAHWLDFRRFFSDMTRDFNREQVEIIRAGAPGRFVTHNLMMFEQGFDHWDLAEDLDFASWDSYPLGFLRQLHERAPWIVDDAALARYGHTGHPDIVAFHHDLYRALGKARGGPDQFWIMEQQPGPVNWASYNVAPSDKMIQTWTLEGLAHGAQTVSYFRWRQAPWAQEQMHSGLNSPWDDWDQAALEVMELTPDLPKITTVRPSLDPKTTLGLYMDYETLWAFEALSQGADLDARLWVFTWYQAARELGLNVEFFGPKCWTAQNLTGVRLAILPSMLINRPALNAFLMQDSQAHLVFGPRSGSHTAHLAFENQDPLSAAPRGSLSPPPYLTAGKTPIFSGLQVRRVESLPPEAGLAVTLPSNDSVAVQSWAEHLRLEAGSGLRPFGHFSAQGSGRRAGLQSAGVQTDRATYLGFHPDKSAAKALIKHFAGAVGLDVQDLGPDVRLRRTQDQTFVSNYGPAALDWPGHPVLGQVPIAPGRLALFARDAAEKKDETDETRLVR